MNLGISKQLDYNLYTNGERAQQVRELFTPEIEKMAMETCDQPSTQKELETAANFILYGKDPKNDKNFCQKKEIHIDQAKSSYKRKEPESLDALLENPLTNENDFMPVQRSPYKKVKPVIDREKDKDIPGMQDLWAVIDVLAAQVKALKDAKTLNLEYYKKNHMLISLRKEQFALKDSVSEAVHARNLHFSKAPIVYEEDTGYVRDYRQEAIYCGWKADHYRAQFGEDWYENQLKKVETLRALAQEKEWDYVEVSKNTIDFTNPNHVYAVLEMYGTLKALSYDNLQSNIRYLLWELEDYIEKAELPDVRQYILIRKIDKATNDKIKFELQNNFGVTYSENYISTIYKQIICGKIADAAKLAQDEFTFRNQPEKFKVCSTCGRKLFRDKRNFIKKPNSKDGLAARCKDCDKRIRDEKKKKNK